MSEEYELDGITYIVIGSKQQRGWHGYWLCQECSERGPRSRLVDSEDAAIELAKINLLMHHGAKHKPR